MFKLVSDVSDVTALHHIKGRCMFLVVNSKKSTRKSPGGRRNLVNMLIGEFCSGIAVRVNPCIFCRKMN